MRISLRIGRRPALLRLAVAGVAGAGGGAATRGFLSSTESVLIAWDITALSYLALTWPAIWRLDAEGTERLATTEDNTRLATDTVIFGAALTSLLGMALLLVSRATGGTRLGEVIPGLGGVLLSWALIHTMFTLRYARLYYDNNAGGLLFSQETPPSYSDFAYVAFTVAMTFQPADTRVTTGQMRMMLLRHSLVSYMFGAAIFALVIQFLGRLTI